MKSLPTMFVLATFGIALALPTENFVIVTGNQKNTYYDIFANESIPSCTTNDFDDVPRVKNGLIDSRYRWRDFVVVLDPAYTSAEKNAIENAMGTLAQTLPCVTFKLHVPNEQLENDHIQIIKGTSNGCSSQIGRRGGKQFMNLQSPGCLSQGTIMHEMIHALGFRHEQSRFDRDDYVNVNFENVIPGREHNFEKAVAGHSVFDVAYDTTSIMHYGGYDFSANGQPTITAKNGGLVGSRGILQNSDIQRLKNMYQC